MFDECNVMHPAFRGVTDFDVCACVASCSSRLDLFSSCQVNSTSNSCLPVPGCSSLVVFVNFATHLVDGNAMSTLNAIMVTTGFIGKLKEEVKADRDWSCSTFAHDSLSETGLVILAWVVVGVKFEGAVLLAILAMFTVDLHGMQVFRSDLSGMSCVGVHWNRQK